MMGKWDNFPAELRHRMANVMQKTRHFKPYKFNIAVGYTGNSAQFRFKIYVNNYQLLVGTAR